MKIEDHPAFAEKLPRMCYVIGSEENPIKIGEEFEFDGGEYQMEKDGVACSGGVLWPAPHKIFEMINHPEKIIRRPQFSDNEKALMRLYVNAGYPIFEPDSAENYIVAWDKDEADGYGIPEGILSQITERFDAAAYLESEESK